MLQLGRLQRFVPMLLAGTVACAAGPRSSCGPVPAEYLVGGGPVYRACQVDKAARPAMPSRMPANFRPTQQCGRATIEFVVGADGTPISETAKVIRATDVRLVEAVMIELPNRHYTPATLGDLPVRQLAQYDFMYSVTLPSPGSSSRPRKC